MSTLMVLLGTHLGWPTATFAAINGVLALFWIGFVLLIGREHRRRIESGKPRCTGRPFPGESQGRLVMQERHTSGLRPTAARVSLHF
jgi:hypothetical protein